MREDIAPIKVERLGESEPIKELEEECLERADLYSSLTSICYWLNEGNKELKRIDRSLTANFFGHISEEKGEGIEYSGKPIYELVECIFSLIKDQKTKIYDIKDIVEGFRKDLK